MKQHDPKMVEAVARAICAVNDRRVDVRWPMYQDEATAALDTLAAMGALVPQGWQAVPVEMTDQIHDALHAAIAAEAERGHLMAGRVYAAALAAAPKPGDVP